MPGWLLLLALSHVPFAVMLRNEPQYRQHCLRPAARSSFNTSAKATVHKSSTAIHTLTQTKPTACGQPEMGFQKCGCLGSIKYSQASPSQNRIPNNPPMVRIFLVWSSVGPRPPGPCLPIPAAKLVKCRDEGRCRAEILPLLEPSNSIRCDVSEGLVCICIHLYPVHTCFPCSSICPLKSAWE